MAVPEMSGVTPIQPQTSVNEVSAAGSTEQVVFDPIDERYEQNKLSAEQTRKNVNAFAKKYGNYIKYTDKWFTSDYITLTLPEGVKMTYGQLRKSLGIPKGVLRKMNGGDKSIIDKNQINGSVKIDVEAIGWYERAMGEMEAHDAIVQRNYGNPYGGYDRAFERGNDAIEDIFDK